MARVRRGCAGSVSLGILLLVIVNLIWVSSSEITQVAPPLPRARLLCPNLDRVVLAAVCLHITVRQALLRHVPGGSQLLSLSNRLHVPSCLAPRVSRASGHVIEETKTSASVLSVFECLVACATHIQAFVFHIYFWLMCSMVVTVFLKT